MPLDMDEKTLNRIINLMILVIFVFIAATAVVILGMPGDSAPEDDPINTDIPGKESDDGSDYDESPPGVPDSGLAPWERQIIALHGKGPANDKDTEIYDPVAEWTYGGYDSSYAFSIHNETLSDMNMLRREWSCYRNSGSLPDNDLLCRYVTTEDKEGAVQHLSDWFIRTSAERGWGDYDTVQNVLAFVRAIPPEDVTVVETEEEVRFPIETIAYEGGDELDYVLVGAAVLSGMGYDVSLLRFNDTFDEGLYYPGRVALGILGDATLTGAGYKLDVVKDGSRLVYFPVNGSCRSDMIPEDMILSGYFSGLATCYSEGCDPVNVGQSRYYPWNDTLQVAMPPGGLARVSEEGGNVPWYVFENTTFSRTVTYFPVNILSESEIGWYDPSLVPEVPLITPIGTNFTVFVGHDNRIDRDLTAAKRSPAMVETKYHSEENLSGIFGLPISGYLANGGASVPSRTVEWVPSGAGWQSMDTWRLHDHLLNIEGNYTLYDSWGHTCLSSAAAWRIRCCIVDEDDDNMDGMTPYSDVRIALFRVNDESGEFTLYDTFGWQHTRGAGKLVYFPVYETGTFDVAVFVRNCEVEMDIEFHQVRPAVTGGDS